MGAIETSVLVREAAKFNMCGQFLGYPLRTVAEAISRGLASRLHHYAIQRLDDAGFKKAIEGWDAEVYTLDGDEKPADRSYCVRFKNAKGGYIEVVQILTRSGWPSLDHGLDIGCE